MSLDDEVARGRDDLRRLVAIPSVSARGEGLAACAAAVRELLDEAGFRTEIHPGRVGPYVVGDTGGGPCTLMIYNHYDVQPEDPLALWDSPPYELSERDGRWFGRGVADDKGEFMSRLAGWRLFRERHPGPVPFRLIWVVDGEEEIGSPSLDAFIGRRFAHEQVDACWWEYGEIDSSGRPIILCGFKGVLGVELRCRTARADLHSSLGAVFDNPLWRLAQATASMRDAAGLVLIDGFHDTVRPPTPEEVAVAAHPPFSFESLKAATGGQRPLDGVNGMTFFPAMNFAPCLNVNGIGGGYAGDGMKTVVPAEGFVKLDFRLVPDQDPRAIVPLVRAHLDRTGFADVELIVHDDVVKPIRAEASHWFIGDARALLEKHFERPAIVQPSSAASGTAHPFVERLGATVIGVGLTHHGAMLHSPNENILVEHFVRMVSFSADLFEGMAGRTMPDDRARTVTA